jgi:hypothetical protein
MLTIIRPRHPGASRLVGCWLAGLASMALGASVSLAGEPMTDSVAGTWKLDVTRSTFSSGTMPKSETRTYTDTPKGTHVLIETEHADGQKEKNEVTLTYDGKPHPLAGNADYDSAAAKRVSPSEIQADLIRQGQVIGTLRRLVSPDGKTLTINVKTNKADGTSETAMAVYHRQ